MQKLGQSSTNGYLKYRLPYGTKRISLLDLIPFNVSDGWTQGKAAGLTGALHLCEQALLLEQDPWHSRGQPAFPTYNLAFIAEGELIGPTAGFGLREHSIYPTQFLSRVLMMT